MPAPDTSIPPALALRLETIRTNERTDPSRAALSQKELWLFVGVSAAIALAGVLVLAL